MNNEGSCYGRNSGIFKAPIYVLYSFTASFTADSVDPKTNCCLGIYVEGKARGGTNVQGKRLLNSSC